jgi:glycosyltransferase involved in cell wall biosynthesis
VLLNLLAAVEGGQITRARHFLQRLRLHDPDTPFLVLKSRGTLPFCTPVPGIDVRDVPLGTSGLSRAARRMLWENIHIPRLMSRPPGFLYLTFSHYLPSTFPPGVPSVLGVSNLAPLSSHGYEADPSLIGRAKMRMLRHTIIDSARRATAVIALSNTCKAVLEQNGVAGNKMHVVPNGVAVGGLLSGQCERVLARLKLRAGYLLCVSHFHPYKNFLRLVQAYRLIAPSLRAAHPLVLVGKPIDTACFDAVRTAIRAAGLEYAVHIVPGLDQDDLRCIYAGAVGLVFPSLVENSPNILLEAMATGLPVMTGRVGAMLEFGGTAPAYFDPLSIVDMARAVESVLTNAALREAMRARSLAQAVKFTWDDFTHRVVSIYQSVDQLYGPAVATKRPSHSRARLH